MSKVVLITGCSSSTGCDLAQRLDEAGYTVVATGRKGVVSQVVFQIKPGMS
ncbi:MAG: hypothetical protein M1281_16270 [Chloroflexi bacterium]|nr:hypothetical protein [Chloroflexota bacterium]